MIKTGAIESKQADVLVVGDKPSIEVQGITGAESATLMAIDMDSGQDALEVCRELRQQLPNFPLNESSGTSQLAERQTLLAAHNGRIKNKTYHYYYPAIPTASSAPVVGQSNYIPPPVNTPAGILAALRQAPAPPQVFNSVNGLGTATAANSEFKCLLLTYCIDNRKRRPAVRLAFKEWLLKYGHQVHVKEDRVDGNGHDLSSSLQERLDISHGILCHCDFKGTNLSYAMVTGVQFEGADLTDAELSWVDGLTCEQLKALNSLLENILVDPQDEKTNLIIEFACYQRDMEKECREKEEKIKKMKEDDLNLRQEVERLRQQVSASQQASSLPSPNPLLR